MIDVTGPARLDLAASATSVGSARSFVRELCRDAGLPRELCDTAALLTSETVTNSLLHGGDGARLAVTAGADGLLVEVADDDDHQPQPGRLDDPDAVGGRGLAIVAHLSDEWGTYATPGGKVVWFRIDRA